MPTNAADDRELTATIAAMDDRAAVRVLATIVRPRLRDGDASPGWTPELGRALCAEFDVSAESGAADAGELARQSLLLLAQDPGYAGPVAAMARGPAPERFDLGVVSGTALVAASLFVLQSHVEFQRDKDGRWSFKYKRTPTKDSVLRPLIAKIVSMISGGAPGGG